MELPSPLTSRSPLTTVFPLWLAIRVEADLSPEFTVPVQEEKHIKGGSGPIANGPDQPAAKTY